MEKVMEIHGISKAQKSTNPGIRIWLSLFFFDWVLSCGHSKGLLRPVLKINLLGKGSTARLSMRDRGCGSWAPVLTDKIC